MRNHESGSITIDFMFALTIAIGFSAVLFAIAFTLTMVEVGQYVTYAMSRSYNAAQSDKTLQEGLGIEKYRELISNPVLAKLLSSGWVVFSNPVVGDFSDEYDEEEPGNEVFVGARLGFQARILNINIPLLGSTSENPSTGKAILNSYLLREPSTTECRDSFNKRRYEKLLELHPSYRQTPGQAKSVLVTDNAC